MDLHTFTRPKGLARRRRVGRGGKRGKTSGRGGKGQTARAGAKPRPELRDIIKKLPKRRGFGRNRGRTVVPRVPFAPVSLDTVAKKFSDGGIVTPGALVKEKLVRRVSGKIPPVKILGGSASSALHFRGVFASASAKAAIEQAGGSVEEKRSA